MFEIQTLGNFHATSVKHKQSTIVEKNFSVYQMHIFIVRRIYVVHMLKTVVHYKNN